MNVPSTRVITSGANATPDLDIVHAKWNANWHHGENTAQHVFINPDVNSSVAAIEIGASHHAEHGTTVTINIIDRPGLHEANLDFFRSHELDVTDIISCDVLAEKAFARLELLSGENGFYSAVGLITNDWAFGRRRNIEKQPQGIKDDARKAINVLRETDIISADPKIRNAMLDAIAANVTPFKMLTAPVGKIAKD